MYKFSKRITDDEAQGKQAARPAGPDPPVTHTLFPVRHATGEGVLLCSSRRQLSKVVANAFALPPFASAKSGRDSAIANGRNV